MGLIMSFWLQLLKARLPVASFKSWRDARASLDIEGLNLDTLLGVDGDFYLYGESIAHERGFDSSVQAAYTRLQAQARRTKAGSPPIYWALLAMDGDRMGEFLRCVQQSTPRIETRLVSEAMNEFAQRRVPEIVAESDGRLIFAGGDDVLAMFPLTVALSAANRMRLAFREVFQTWYTTHAAATDFQQDKLPTISAAIVYAHYQTPLGRVIEAAKTLLKRWAKARADRDAVAIQRFLRGGTSETCAYKWNEGREDVTSRLAHTIGLIKDEKDRPVALADRSAYNLRHFAWMLGPNGYPFSGDAAHRRDFLASLLRKSRLGDEDVEPTASPSDDLAPRERQSSELMSRTQRLLDLCDSDVAASPATRSVKLSTDTLILARFLAGEGREER
jgi:CRISPR-associated protein Cmr2